MTRQRNRFPSVYLWSAAFIMLLGFTLRVHLLDGQSMWSDEGLSVYRAQQSLPELLRNIITVDGVETRDTNPPFYFMILRAARRLTGESVFAMRFVGVAGSMTALALMLALGRVVAPPRVGLIAVFFFAISPLHVWETQILRNYPLLVALNLASIYGLFRFLLRPNAPRRWRWLALWLAAGLLGIYTHYFAFFVFAFGLTSITIWAIRGWLRRAGDSANTPPWWQIALPIAGASLLLLPFIPAALERFAAGQQVDFNQVPPLDMLAHMVAAFGVGQSRTLTHPLQMWLPAVALALLGLATLWRHDRLAALLLTGYLIIPLGLLVLLSAINPLYNGTRHLLIGLPPFLLLVAVGIAGPDGGAASSPRHVAWLMARLALALAVIAIQFTHLRAQFDDADYVHDDVRGAAEYLSQVAAPDDLIILHDTLIRFTFDYYYRGSAPVVSTPRYGDRDEAEVTRRLLAEGATADRVWFLTQPSPRTGFPRDLLPGVAHDKWVHISTRDFSYTWLPTRLEGFVADATQTTLPDTAIRLAATFRDDVRLEGYEPIGTIWAGAPWWGRFYFTALSPAETTYSLALRLVDEAGVTWAQAGGSIWPEYGPRAWPADTLIRHDHELATDAGLPPGTYDLWLRLLDADLEVLPLTDGSIDVYLGQVTVEASTDVSQLPQHTNQRAQWGPITFLGYRLPDTDLRPGHLLSLDVFWLARQTPKQDYQVMLEMLDESGTVLAQASSPLSREDYPTSLWKAGEVIQGKLGLEIPGGAAGNPRLRLTRLGKDGRALGRPVVLAESPTILPWPMVTELPPIPRPLVAGYGDSLSSGRPLITLQGFDAPETAAPGSSVPLTLFWRSEANLDRNLVVFLHLTDSAGEVLAQTDGVPVNGTRLTLSWRAGEVLTDERVLQLPADLPQGTYELSAGFYDPDSLARLAAWTPAQEYPDGGVPLGRLTIEESP